MRTLKIWHAFAMLIAVTILFTACNKKGEELVLDFNVTVPDSWEERLQEYNGMISYLAISPNNLASGDTLQETVVITKEQLPSTYNLATYYNTIKLLIEDAEGYAFVSENLDTTVASEPCRKIVYKEYTPIILYYRAPVDTVDTTLVLTKYFFVKNTYGYQVSFTALQETIAEFKPVFEEIITSFSFKN
jgi:hypothetical protein